MSLKIALVYPSIEYKTELNVLKTFVRLIPPQGIGYLTGYIREKGYNNIRLFDEQLTSLDDNQALQSLIDYNPGIVGISCNSAMYFRTLEIVNTVKKVLPKATIILGGPQPTLEPGSVIENSNVDFIIRGEGELAFHAFLEAFPSGEFGKVPGLTYKVNGQITNNKDIVPIMDLDELPVFPYGIFARDKRYHLGKYISSHSSLSL